VCEYTEEHYLPAAAAYRQRVANMGRIGQNILNWRQTLEQNWSHVEFGPMKMDTRGDQQVIEIEIRLPGVDANAVRVELYADARDGRETVRQEMTRLRNVLGGPGRVDRSTVSASRPASDFTPRLEGFRCGWRLSRSLAAVNLQ
jgi:starch phosphorylase